MLAAISHDLRTPLTRIRLRGEFIDDPVQRSALFRDVDDLQMMVDGALSFFRGDANTEAMTSFDLSGLLQIVVDDFADQGVEIEYAGSARAAFYGRPFALKRAITNLVENAVKYATPPVIELTHGGGAFIIAIRDHGPGIPAEALEHVFQPFFRLESSRHRATGGVGLGLTAAQVVIREHGGEIALLNLPGAGLEAVVTLPRSEPEPESIAK
jgi:signal transduction histidine kinase